MAKGLGTIANDFCFAENSDIIIIVGVFFTHDDSLEERQRGCY